MRVTEDEAAQCGRIPGYIATLLHYCLATLLPGYTTTFLPYYMATSQPAFL